MAYIPPHLRKKATATASSTVTRRGVRFIGNVTGETNVAPNIGTRHSPRRSRSPKRSVIKRTGRVSLNSKPVAKPTTKISEMPTKFRQAVFSAIGYVKKSIRRPRHGKKRGTRKVK